MRCLIFALATALLLTTGCKPTPDEGAAETGGRIADSGAFSGSEESKPVLTRIATAEEVETMLEDPDVNILPGRWGPLRDQAYVARSAMTPEQLERAEQLQAIGYAAGSAPASELRNVTRYRADLAYAGYNLYNSGHGPEALLTDMDGKVVHSWQFPFERLGNHPMSDTANSWRSFHTKFWRRVHLYENGDLLAIYEGLGLIKIDKDSNLIWAAPNGAHHDVTVQPDGDIYVLLRHAHLRADMHPDEPVLEDYIAILSPDGIQKRRVSLLDSLKKSPYAAKFLPEFPAGGDLFHTNAIKVLEGRIAAANPAFASGNILTSLRNLNAVGIVNLDRATFVWLKTGGFAQQHDPRILANGNMLIFDNEGAGEGSRVLEVDLAQNQLVWLYEGTADDPFYSQTCGTAQRLPNGNTLITESDAGRAFEVTPDGTKVWEFYNPHRAGERDQYIATLFEVVRLPEDFPVDWADGISSD